MEGLRWTTLSTEVDPKLPVVFWSLYILWQLREGKQDVNSSDPGILTMNDFIFVTWWLLGCHSNSKISYPIYMKCKCVFTLLSGEVLSVMRMVTYLTKNPLSWEEAEEQWWKDRENYLDHAPSQSKPNSRVLLLGKCFLQSYPFLPPPLPYLHFLFIFFLCSLCQITENTK